MSELIAYDSANPLAIPPIAQAVLVYADGHFHWPHTMFPRALWKGITAFGDPGIDIADYEPGCIYSPAALRGWADERLRLGNKDLTVYCDRDNYPVVAEAMGGLEWSLWLATLDGTKPAEYDGKQVRAVQYTTRTGLYDMSLVYDRDWLNKP